MTLNTYRGLYVIVRITRGYGAGLADDSLRTADWGYYIGSLPTRTCGFAKYIRGTRSRLLDVCSNIRSNSRSNNFNDDNDSYGSQKISNMARSVDRSQTRGTRVPLPDKGTAGGAYCRHRLSRSTYVGFENFLKNLVRLILIF